MASRLLSHGSWRKCKTTSWLKVCKLQIPKLFSTQRKPNLFAEAEALRVTSIGLYRILMRECKSVVEKAQNQPFLIQPPLHIREYGQAKTFSSSSFKVSTEVSERSKAILSFFQKHCCLGKRNNSQDIIVSEESASAIWEEMMGLYEESTRNEDDPALFVHPSDLYASARQSFLRSRAIYDTSLVIQWHRFAIDAIKLLHEQTDMMDRTSISEEHGIRIVATSRCTGPSRYGTNLVTGTKYRFAYRIRVENIRPPFGTNNEEEFAVQLLGRTWNIQEDSTGETEGELVTVDAPTTGAVGILPVLRPGDVFEYMSGCELSTRTGTMSGHLHMAWVEKDADSTVVGERTSAFQSHRKFRVSVNPFRLISDSTDDDSRP